MIRLRRARLEAPMKSLNQLPVLPTLLEQDHFDHVRNRKMNKNLRGEILISLEGGVLNHRGHHVFVHVLV
jgi:hypothetical protein